VQEHFAGAWELLLALLMLCSLPGYLTVPPLLHQVVFFNAIKAVFSIMICGLATIASQFAAGENGSRV
jgi:hypothetical protein